MPAARFQVVDNCAKRHAGRDLGQPLLRLRDVIEQPLHFAPQQQKLDLLAGIERREVELLQASAPLLGQLLLPIEIGAEAGISNAARRLDWSAWYSRSKSSTVVRTEENSFSAADASGAVESRSHQQGCKSRSAGHGGGSGEGFGRMLSIVAYLLLPRQSGHASIRTSSWVRFILGC